MPRLQVIFILTSFLICVSGCQYRDEQQRRQQYDDSVLHAEKYARMEELEKYAAVLGEHFVDHEGLLYHTHWSSPFYRFTDSTQLIAYISGDGTLQFTSVLVNSPRTGLHNRIDLHIGDSVFTSDKSGYGTWQNKDTVRVEFTSFYQSKNNYMGDVIARHVKDTIGIHTFFDDQELKTYTLTEEDNKALYECIEYSRTLLELDSLEENHEH